MGILGVIGIIILVLTHFGLASVSQGWYIFWWVIVILNTISMGIEGRSKISK